jgi:hypothetical protein
MARISYLGIAAQIKRILESDQEIAEKVRTITIAEGHIQAAELLPWIGIYPLTRRPSANQVLAAHTRWRFEVSYEIWVYSLSMVGPEAALEITEELLGLVEVALLREPTLGGTVQMIRLDGGDFDNAKVDESFVMGGSVRLNVLAMATTT